MRGRDGGGAGRLEEGGGSGGICGRVSPSLSRGRLDLNLVVGHESSTGVRCYVGFADLDLVAEINLKSF